MVSSEQLLHSAAEDGSLDPKEWPRVLETVLNRLDHIVFNEFPRPSPLPVVPSTPIRAAEVLSSQDSQSANKENAPPSTPPSRPPVPPFSASQTSTSSSPPSGSSQFPQDLQLLHASIRNSLIKNFPKNPPHTVQRLAELVVAPKAHYRYLPSYLNALERVVSVSSPTTIFPLPQAVLPSNDTLSNGTYPTPASSANSLGSDESLGGALLTPIPWLRQDRSQEQSDTSQGNELISESTEMVEGPNGAGRIETVTVSSGMVRSPQVGNNTRILPSQPNPEALRDTGSVTQGELLRQEQEAGVVPTTQVHARARASASPEDSFHDSESSFARSDDEEHPHARGPSEIGAADTGPQTARGTPGELDLAAAVGRPAVVTPKDLAAKKSDEKAEVEMTDADAEGEIEPATAAVASEGNNGKGESKEQDVDGDVVLEDAEAKTEEEDTTAGAEDDAKA